MNVFDIKAKAEHIQRHKELHKALDELCADFISNTGLDVRLNNTSVLDLMSWSHRQTIDPVEPSQG